MQYLHTWHTPLWLWRLQFPGKESCCVENTFHISLLRHEGKFAGIHPCVLLHISASAPYLQLETDEAPHSLLDMHGSRLKGFIHTISST